MSAIHTGSVAARLRTDGMFEYTGTSEEHAITDWTRPEFDVLIPAQRAGSAYERVVLDTDTDVLPDLSDLVYIPSLRGFVKEAKAGQDVPQTADHTAGGDPQ